MSQQILHKMFPFSLHCENERHDHSIESQYLKSLAIKIRHFYHFRMYVNIKNFMQIPFFKASKLINMTVSKNAKNLGEN